MSPYLELMQVMVFPVEGSLDHEVEFRGEFESCEVTALHRDAFEVGVVIANETDWQTLLAKHTLGWVTARDRDQLPGFVNVIWDGSSHAWIQDLMVNSATRHLGVGSELVATAREAPGRPAVSGSTLTSRKCSEGSTSMLVDSSRPPRD